MASIVRNEGESREEYVTRRRKEQIRVKRLLQGKETESSKRTRKLNSLIAELS